MSEYDDFIPNCRQCGYPLDGYHAPERCSQVQHEAEVAYCEQAGHELQGDTCYCGTNVHPSVGG